MAKQNAEFHFLSPIDNTELVGHASTLQSFFNAWEQRDTHPIHPTWMLCGPKGIGKATLAYNIASKVYDSVGDLFIVDCAHNIDEYGKPKPNAKSISVSTVRSMIERMQMYSMSGNWRVIIIDSLDELTTQASNALLKILEEPPAKTLFLLVTHKLSNILPTIRSRARIEKMHPLTLTELRELCNKFMPDTEISQQILKLCNGSFGKIANLKLSGGDIIYEEMINALQNKRYTSTDIMAVATKIANASLYDIVLDAIAYFKLSDIYPKAIRCINDIQILNLKSDIAIFNILMEMKKCL